MSKFFSFDSRVWDFLTKVANLLLVNLFWLVFCLPIVTIGPATTAMYSVQLCLIRSEDVSVFNVFWKNFRCDFGKSLVLFLFVGLLTSLAIVCLIVLFVMIPGLSAIEKVLFSIPALIIFLFVGYVFPLNAKYENSVIQTLKNALVLSLVNIFPSFCVLVFTTSPIWLHLIFPIELKHSLFFMATFAFSLIGYGNTLLLNRVFIKHFPEELQAVDA